MKKQMTVTLILGAVLCLTAGGILGFDRSEAERGQRFREKAQGVQQEIWDLENQIEENEKLLKAAQQDLDRAKEAYGEAKRGVDQRLERVIQLYYSDDPVAQNVLRYKASGEKLEENIFGQLDFIDNYEFRNMQEIRRNEFSYPEGPRFVSESGDQRILKLANLYYDIHIKGQEETRDDPFYEFDGWTVVFRDSGLEETEGKACRAEGRTFCVRDEENRTLYLPADPHCVDREMLHGLAHILAGAHEGDRGFQAMAGRLYERGNEYGGALLSPTLYLENQDEFMAEMIHGALLDSDSYRKFDMTMDVDMLLWGWDVWYDEEDI